MPPYGVAIRSSSKKLAKMQTSVTHYKFLATKEP